jgi:type II secretory pathway pseudopilin PulG
MAFVSAVTIPDFLPRKPSQASLCQADSAAENVERFISDYRLVLRIALWFILAQTLVVLALAYVTLTKWCHWGQRHLTF